MANVEIWKSKPEWSQASAGEQRQVRQTLDEFLRRYLARADGTCGPFMPCNDTGCTLVWEVSDAQAARLYRDYERILGRFFIPVMSGRIEGLTARDYADAISRDG